MGDNKERKRRFQVIWHPLLLLLLLLDLDERYTGAVRGGEKCSLFLSAWPFEKTTVAAP